MWAPAQSGWTCKLMAYTCGNTSKCISHTPAVGKSLRDTPKRCSHTPVVGKSLRSPPKRCSHTPAASKSLRDAPERWLHTPAVDKSLRHQPWHSQGYLHMLCGCLDHIYVGTGMKSGATGMNLVRPSCEKFLLLVYHVLHSLTPCCSMNCQWERW